MSKPRKSKRVTDRMIATKFRHYFSIQGCADYFGVPYIRVEMAIRRYLLPGGIK